MTQVRTLSESQEEGLGTQRQAGEVPLASLVHTCAMTMLVHIGSKMFVYICLCVCVCVCVCV
jgi:hypothetical protein